MVGFKHTLCALLLTMVTGMAIAQNNTNSPYTRYGYGDLSDQSFGNSKAMGGIAFGLRDGAQINPLNPASYTAIDSLTFIFEGGVSLQNMNISGGGVKLNAKNSSFDYLAMQFRLHPRVAMSIGLLPFSNVGYSVSESNEATETSPYSTKSLTGEGGLHQLYVGAGVKVLKNLSVGVNASYFWGDITRSLTQLYPNTASAYSYIRQNAVSVSDYKLDFGLQYTQEFNKKHSATIGAVYSPKHKLNNDYTVTTQASSTVSQDWDATLEVPNTFGVGFTYNYDKRLTVGREIIHSVGDVFLHYGFVERMQIVRKIASDRVFLSQSLVLYGCDEHHAVRISRDGVLSSVCHARCIGGEIPWSERSAKP